MLVVVFDLLPLVALYGEPKAWPMVEAVSDRRLLLRQSRTRVRLLGGDSIDRGRGSVEPGAHRAHFR